MKIVHESIFMGSLRAFFSALFGVLGALVALVAALFLIYALFSTAEEKAFSADVKIRSDAEGHRKKLAHTTPVILQINIDGEIGSEKLTGSKIEEHLISSREEAFATDRVKGILLVINSPGGGVNDSDIIYRHLKAYKKKYNIPVFAYVDGLAASGGYYIACASDKIYASDVSLIGSIGVVGWPPFFNMTEALEKLGVSSKTLSAGKGKDEMNPFRPWREGEEDHYQALISHFYKQFVAIVAENRPIDRREIEERLGAAVYPSSIAKELGLIDVNGSSRGDVLTALVEAAGIKGEYQVVGFETQTWWKKMFKEEPTSPLYTGKIKHELAHPFQKEGFQFYFK